MTTAQQADVIIVGGGIFGCAIAYYYTRNNPGRKVLVLERNEICNAATSRAAALLTRIRSKQHFIPLSLETYAAIAAMEKQLQESLDIKQTGVLHIAASENSVNDLKQLMQIAAEFGDTAEYIDNNTAKQKLPWLQTDEVLATGFMPTESYCDPYLLGTFFARCAKMQGANIRQGVAVTGLIQQQNIVTGVSTSAGNFYADAVVIATGTWSPLLGKQVGVGLPLAPVRSQYWITERHNLFPVTQPIALLPDAQAYARPEGGSLLFGIREPQSLVVSPDKIPDDISNYSFSADGGMADLAAVMHQLAKFFPGIYDIGLKHYIAGFSGYTPDNNLSIGKVPGVEQLFAAAGCVGAGISTAGGVGLALAELVAGKQSPFDISAFNLERFGVIDPFSDEWLQQCALARSQKRSG
ncbi:NAD(P)/FAD-dependent oxidoreductase [Limnovirga soli]|uniref:FAD-dependent oxidoreductase n=1 Tax=Limnovirga soli TaxID=2656915 RepID=A0A8J8JTU2_9BACT|nr:FAD-binding oxidoreductase [Limnovirga soli]NNV55595.1 FAD-dependent oxidoreductase [Limnovirga soli]